jgi:hypothetical protein
VDAVHGFDHWLLRLSASDKGTGHSRGILAKCDAAISSRRFIAAL